MIALYTAAVSFACLSAWLGWSLGLYVALGAMILLAVAFLAMYPCEGDD